MNRITFVVGHFGSGKTEFAVNYAQHLAKTTPQVTLIDMDIANPYFRSYDVRDQLEAAGVTVINGGYIHQADLPSLSPEAYRVFTDTAITGIFDVGGNDNGARVLGYYSEEIDQTHPEVWCVINPMRPEPATVEKTRQMIKRLAAAARTKVPSLILTAHMFEHTTSRDINEAYAAFKIFENVDALPLKYVMIHSQVQKKDIQVPEALLFTIDTYMQKPWETER